MRIKEIIKYALTKNIRERKNIYFGLILMICTIIALGSLSFRNWYFFMLERGYDKDPLYRTLIISPNIKEYIANEGNFEYDIDKLKKIEHVIDIYDMNFSMFDLEINYFKELGYDGMVEFVYGSKYMLPQNIIGRTFSDDDTGVAICSKNFYPSLSEVSLFEQKDIFINEDDLLNKTFKIEEDIYKRVNGELVNTHEKYTKEIEIIGVFDTNETGELLNTCYLPPKDMEEIYNNALKDIYSNSGTYLIIVVDDRDDFNSVISEIVKLGYRAEPQTVINYEFINTIRLICDLLIAVSVVVIIVITVGYVRKKILDNTYEIGILKALGYKKSHIELINIIQVFNLSFIAFLSGVILFEIIINLFEMLCKNFLIFNNYIIVQYMSTFIIVGLIMCLIPSIITYIIVYKESKKDTITIIKNIQT